MLEKLYEKITGRCWHVYTRVGFHSYRCMKCGKEKLH